MDKSHFTLAEAALVLAMIAIIATVALILLSPAPAS